MIYLVPLIGALIGWVTNYVAVKMLFHPREPFRFCYLFPIQGVFPKRQKELAKRLGEIVSQELFSVQDVRDLLVSKASSEEVQEMIKAGVSKIISERLVQIVPMVAAFLSPELLDKIKGIVLEEITRVMEGVIHTLGNDPSNTIDVHSIVEEKVANFSSDKLEAMLFAIMKREFRFIEYIGAVLGFLIGVAQVLLLSYPW